MKPLKNPTEDQKGLKKLPEEVRNNMGYLEEGGSVKKYKKGGKVGKKGKGYASLDAAEKEVYKRGLAAYMSSEIDPKLLSMPGPWQGQSAFGGREAAKIRAGKGKSTESKLVIYLHKI